MQAIVVPDRSFDRLKRHTDFIKAAIFPGGCLPSIGALTAAANRSGLPFATSTRSARTTAKPSAAGAPTSMRSTPSSPRSGSTRDSAGSGVFYLAYCEAGFDERYIGATQFLVHRAGFPRSSRHRRGAARSRFDPIAV